MSGSGGWMHINVPSTLIRATIEVTDQWKDRVTRIENRSSCSGEVTIHHITLTEATNCKPAVESNNYINIHTRKGT